MQILLGELIQVSFSQISVFIGVVHGALSKCALPMKFLLKWIEHRTRESILLVSQVISLITQEGSTVMMSLNC